MGRRRPHGRSCLLVAMAAVTAGAGTVTGTGNVTCPSTDRVMHGYSIFQGGIAAASTIVADQTACCALCHGDYKDECQGWVWIDRTKVQCMYHPLLYLLHTGPTRNGHCRFPYGCIPAVTPQYNTPSMAHTGR